MHKEPYLEPLYSALKDLVTWFQKGKCPGIIIGGLAASLLGRPRTTRDVDALVLCKQEDWPEFLELGKKLGFQARQEDALAFARENRVLLVRHQASLIDVDISFALLPFEKESLERAREFRIADVSIPLPSPEDLIIMKAVSHRPVDMEDIRCILDVNPELDFSHIEYWVKEFAKVLEMPEIYDETKKLMPPK